MTFTTTSTHHPRTERIDNMLPQTFAVDDRIKDLHETATELRNARSVTPDRRFGWTQGLRLRLGTSLLAAGSALVSGANPATPSRAGR
jgi:hypothetical protein